MQGQGWVSGGSTELVGGAGPEAERTPVLSEPPEGPPKLGPGLCVHPRPWPCSSPLQVEGNPYPARGRRGPTGWHKPGSAGRRGLWYFTQGPPASSHPGTSTARHLWQPCKRGRGARGVAATEEAGLRGAGDREDNQPRPDPHPHPRRRRSSQALSRATLACAWTA